jgi:hypothetical protein
MIIDNRFWVVVIVDEKLAKMGAFFVPAWQQQCFGGSLIACERYSSREK